MVYKRPVFKAISLLYIRDSNEAKRELIGAAAVYRSFVEETLVKAQRKWINSIVSHEDSSDAVDEILTQFSRCACLHGPRLEPFDTIAINGAPLYFYCPLRKMEEYANESIVSFHSKIGSVVCSMSPYAAGVTSERLRYDHNKISPGSCLFGDALEAYIAFFPSKSFLDLPYSLYEVHNGYAHKLFSLPPGSSFCCEVIAVGLAFPATGPKKRVSKPLPKNHLQRRAVSRCFTGKTGTCL